MDDTAQKQPAKLVIDASTCDSFAKAFVERVLDFVDRLERGEEIGTPDLHPLLVAMGAIGFLAEAGAGFVASGLPGSHGPSFQHAVRMESAQMARAALLAAIGEDSKLKAVFGFPL